MNIFIKKLALPLQYLRYCHETFREYLINWLLYSFNIKNSSGEHCGLKDLVVKFCNKAKSSVNILKIKDFDIF